MDLCNVWLLYFSLLLLICQSHLCTCLFFLFPLKNQVSVVKPYGICLDKRAPEPLRPTAR